MGIWESFVGFSIDRGAESSRNSDMLFPKSSNDDIISLY